MFDLKNILIYKYKNTFLIKKDPYNFDYLLEMNT